MPHFTRIPLPRRFPLRGACAALGLASVLACQSTPAAGPSEIAMADTATKLDLTPALLGPHEPTGMNRIIDFGFGATTLAGWTTRGGNLTVLNVNGPLSAAPAVNNRYPLGMKGGVAPSSMTYPLPGTTNPTLIYHRFALRLSPNFQAHRSGTNKIYHLWVGASGGWGNHVFYSAENSSCTVNCPGASKMVFTMRFQGVPSTTLPRYRPNLTGGMAAATLTRGVWYTVEVLMQAETIGKSDGWFKVWVNGVPTHDVKGISTGRTAGWKQVQWSPTWGGVGDTVRVSGMYMEMDHMTVSTK